MIERYASLETALLAKEKGFNWDCNSIYNGPNNEEVSKLKEDEGDGTGEINNDILNARWVNLQVYSPPIYCVAPTQSFLQKWLREEKGIDLDCGTTFSRKYSFLIYKGMKPIPDANTDDYDNYEDALEEALQKALALI